MAVIIQEVIGNAHNGRYYPEISGVAQSYNFYPFSYIQPEDGFAVTAIGLEAYVVGGEKTHSFSPTYPKLQLASTQDKIKASQRYFYGVNMLAQDYDLYRDGEKTGKTLPSKHTTSQKPSVTAHWNTPLPFTTS